MDHYSNFTVQDTDFLHWKTLLVMVGFSSLEEAYQSLTHNFTSLPVCFFEIEQNEAA